MLQGLELRAQGLGLGESFARGSHRTSRRQRVSTAGPTVCMFLYRHMHVFEEQLGNLKKPSSEAIAGFDGTGRPGRSRLGGTSKPTHQGKKGCST